MSRGNCSRPYAMGNIEMSSVPIQVGLVDGRAVRHQDHLGRLHRRSYERPGAAQSPTKAKCAGEYVDDVEMAIVEPHGNALLALFTGVLIGTLCGVFYRELGNLVISWTSF